jgi:hypothetical protein
MINTNIRNHKNFSCSITSKDKTSTIASIQLISFSIDESIYGEVKARLSFLDHSRIKTELPILGGEIVEVKFEDKLEKEFTYKFVVLKAESERTNSNAPQSTTSTLVTLDLLEHRYYFLKNTFLKHGILSTSEDAFTFFNTILKQYDVSNIITLSDEFIKGVKIRGLKNLTPPHDWNLLTFIINIINKIDTVESKNNGWFFYLDRESDKFVIKPFSMMLDLESDLTNEFLFMQRRNFDFFNNAESVNIVKNDSLTDYINKGLLDKKLLSFDSGSKKVFKKTYSIQEFFEKYEKESSLINKNMEFLPPQKEEYIPFLTEETMDDYYNNLVKYTIHDTKVMELEVNAKFSNSVGRTVVFFRSDFYNSANEGYSGKWVITKCKTIINQRDYYQLLTFCTYINDTLINPKKGETIE